MARATSSLPVPLSPVMSTGNVWSATRPMTARSRKEDRERCLREGVDECLTKPYNAADLSATMGRVLRTHPPRQLPRLDLLDPPVLLAASGGDPAMLRRMC